MDFGFEGFEAELEDFEVKKIRKWDRVFRIGEGGSFVFTLMHEGVIYATCGDHFVYAIDARNGKEKWKFRTNDCNYGAPSTDGKLVFIPSNDNHVYAVDIKTSKEVWRFKTGGKVFSTPCVCGNVLAFGSEDENVYAVAISSGKLLWRFKTGGFVAATPTFYDGKVFFGSCDHNLYCLDAKSGREVWRFTTGDDIQINREMTISGGRLYFGGLDNYLYCLDVRTGKEIWRFRTGKYGNVTSPSLYKNRLYHPSRDGIVYCLSLEGKEIWRLQVGGFVARVMVKDDVVYFGSEDSYFYVVNAETGKEIWRFKAGGDIYDEAKITGNLVCFGCHDCNYYALDMITGKEVWRFQSSNPQPSPAPPIEDEYRLEIKKSLHIEDAISEEKYKAKESATVSLSDYHVKSEYSMESEYKQKSDYDTNFVIFEGMFDPSLEIPFLNKSSNLVLWTGNR